LESVSNNINEWIRKGIERNGTKFKLIVIKFASTAEPLPSDHQTGKVNTSALVIYDDFENYDLLVESGTLLGSGID
jgi:hypothetical protein